MCMMAWIGNRMYGTAGELRNRLGLKELPLCEKGKKYRPQAEDRFCTCSVNFHELAKLLNCKIEDDCIFYTILLDDHSEVGVFRTYDDGKTYEHQTDPYAGPEPSRSTESPSS